LDLAVRQCLSLYTADRARGTVDTTVIAPPEGENSIVDAPAKKQQKGDFIFRCAPSFTPITSYARGSGPWCPLARELEQVDKLTLAIWLAGRLFGCLDGWFWLAFFSLMWQPRTGWMT